MVGVVKKCEKAAEDVNVVKNQVVDLSKKLRSEINLLQERIKVEEMHGAILRVSHEMESSDYALLACDLKAKQYEYQKALEENQGYYAEFIIKFASFTPRSCLRYNL